MLRQSIMVIKLCLKCKASAAVCKIAIYMIHAVFVPVNIIALQKMIDILADWKGGGIDSHILFWIFLLMLSVFYAANINNFNALVNLSLEHGLNGYLLDSIIQKYDAMDYPNFEDTATQNIMKRVNENPVEKVLRLFDLEMVLLSDFFALWGIAAVFAQVSIWLSAVFVAVLAIVIYLNYLASNLVTKLFFEQTVEERKMDYLRNLLMEKDSLAEIRFFGAVGYIKKI